MARLRKTPICLIFAHSRYSLIVHFTYYSLLLRYVIIIIDIVCVMYALHIAHHKTSEGK